MRSNYYTSEAVKDILKLLGLAAVLLGLLVLFGRAEATERTVLSPDGDVYMMAWDECKDREGPDKAVIYDDNPQSTYALPFPDGTMWTEGQPSPWISREEYHNILRRIEFYSEVVRNLYERVEKLEQDKLPHIELLTTPQIIKENN